MQQIIPGVYTFIGLMAGRVYLIEDRDGLTMIDAGLPPAVDKIVRQLVTAGRRIDRVKRILITHAHPDHVGGLPRLKAITGAQVIASATEKPYVEGREAVCRPPKESLSGLARLMYRPPEAVPGTPVDRVVKDGEVMAEVMGGITAVFSPGHTPGHISFWQADRRILFTGDVLMNMGKLSLPFAAFTVDMAEDRRSVQRLADLQPEVICFGHGPVIFRDASARLGEFADKLS